MPNIGCECNTSQQLTNMVSADRRRDLILVVSCTVGEGLNGTVEAGLRSLEGEGVSGTVVIVGEAVSGTAEMRQFGMLGGT